MYRGPDDPVKGQKAGTDTAWMEADLQIDMRVGKQLTGEHEEHLLEEAQRSPEE